MNLNKYAGIVGSLGRAGLTSGMLLRDGVNGSLNGGGSYGESIGEGLANLLESLGLKDNSNNDYNFLTKSMSDAEIAHKYRQDAAALRRRCRILARKEKAEKELSKRIAESRYF